MLPREFSDLEPFAEKWCLASEHERWEQRMSTSMEDLHALYDAILPRVTDAIAYCDRSPLDDLPADALSLLRLVYSFVLVSFAVELWGQQHVPDTSGTDFVRLTEPLP